MKLIVIGDSIAKGTFTDIHEESPNSIANPNYASILREKLGFSTLTNHAINGISYSSLSPILPEWSLTNICATFERGDMFLLAGGTNDFGTNVPLGSSEDRGDISFYGAVDYVFNELKTRNPTAKMVVLTPIDRHDSDANKNGNSLAQYRTALSEVAKRYGFTVIDGGKFPLRPKDVEFRKAYIMDGVHINIEGHRLLAEYIIKALAETV